MSPFRIEAIALALLTLLLLAVYVLSTHVLPDLDTDGPRLAVYLVAGGAAIAAVGSARLHPPDRATRKWALLRRLPLALLITGMAVWALAVSGHLGVYIEPMSYAVVLIALGIGLWPGPLLSSRVAPPKVGLLVVLYGIVSLTAIVFGGFGLALLAGMPIVVLVALGALTLPKVLELPTETPRVGSAAGPIDTTLASVGSVSGLLVAVLLLTGATMALLVVRLLALWRWFREPFLIDGSPDDPTWLVWLLAAGLVIGVGITVAIRRRPARRTLAAHPESAGGPA